MHPAIITLSKLQQQDVLACGKQLLPTVRLH
jgi:hypothetical protein